MSSSDKDFPIVVPVKTKNTPDLGIVAVMAATNPDFRMLKKGMGFSDGRSRDIFTSKLYMGTGRMSEVSLVGPFIGAPYAAMILETLIAWGAKRIIFVGWCGAISKSVRIGDIIIPTGALVNEGTSSHYQASGGDMVRPSDMVLDKTRRVLTDQMISFREGLIWTTDGAFRETANKVLSFQKKDALGVEMEMSALFSVGAFHQVDVGGILVVSDELTDFTWKPGFKSEAFKKGRLAVGKVVCRLCKDLS